MQTLDERRALERAKYTRVRQRWANYGAACHGRNAVEIIASWKPKAVLDVGCGDNDFSRLLQAASPTTVVRGVDFENPKADYVAPAHDLPFRPESFEIVTAFDVLEHLLPDELEAVLDEFRRVTVRKGIWFFSIGYFPSSAGHDQLHNIVQDHTWWCARLELYGKTSSPGQSHKRRPYLQVNLP